MATYEFRAFRPGDEVPILESFNLVFGEGNDDFEPRSMEDWRWTFTDNPSGIRVWLAMAGDLVAAHYASQPNRMKVDGEDRYFSQIVDSFVHPEHRRGLKRPGLFVEIGQRMLAETCGTEPHQDLVTYGWPIPEAWRMGKTFMRYEMVRMQTSLVKEPGGGSTELPAGVERIRRADECADRLYAKCWPAWGASAVRDHLYLNWRIFDCPRREYEVYVVRDPDGEWAGYAAYRASDWPVPNIGLLVDWLVPDDRPEVGEALAEAVLARSRADGVQALLAIFPEWSVWFRRFQDAGFRVQASTLLMSGRNNDPQHDMAWLRDNWWYQPIELDLV